MATEGEGETASTRPKATVTTGASSLESGRQHTDESKPQTPPKLKEEGDTSHQATTGDSSKRSQAHPEARPAVASLTAGDVEDAVPRQVIAVSASKGPAAFFNLARKFLATDEMCDLSALEGAIVSAVDAAHLLERSQLATIVR